MWEFDFKVSAGIVGFGWRLGSIAGDEGGGRRRIQVCSHRKVR